MYQFRTNEPLRQVPSRATGLLHLIEQHCRRTGMTVSRFGRSAISDPALVFDLRRGRTLSSRVAGRVSAYLAQEGSNDA